MCRALAWHASVPEQDILLQRDVPFTRDLVFVGGGHAHALVLRAWGMDPMPGARLTVINPGPTAPYTGMLPGHVAGHYARDDLEIDLVRLCRHANARFIQDYAVGIDQTTRQVMLKDGLPVSYDVASIDVGITAEMDLPGFAEHGIGAKPLDRFAARWRSFLAGVKEGTVQPDVAVIGSGVAGCELAMAMAFALGKLGVSPQVTVIEAGSDITGMGLTAKKRVHRAMSALGIELRTNASVLEVGADHIRIADQEDVPAQLCVGAAGAFPHQWIAHTALPLQNGFVEVGADLGVTGDDSLFAVGDCAAMPFAPRPKAGVFAVRAAPVLHHNLRAALSGGSRRPFRPQKDYLKLISLGGQTAMAEKFGLTFSGSAMWRWKDRIDQAFMKRLRDLPGMKAPAVNKQSAMGVTEALAQQPLCGGCGAKVDGHTLSQSLKGLTLPGSEEVIAGAGDDAAILRQPGGGFQVISTDHLRAFVEDPRQMTRIALLHAMGDVWAMGAKPQVCLTNIILPQMSAPLQARTLEEITLTTGELCAELDVQVVGGHTTMGAELTIGFTVTGTRSTMPIMLSGGQPGDVLVLTRPLGSGVILAADMQGEADGREVARVLQTMGQPQITAAAALSSAHAMTDITGFGLAGHAQALARASGVAVELWHKDIPVYPGVRALSDKGIASSLMPANRETVNVAGQDDPLLYDPQTAGGLFAALPWADADNAMAKIAAAGGQAYLVGQLVPGAGQVHVI
jgi:selenide,water dikinase